MKHVLLLLAIVAVGFAAYLFIEVRERTAKPMTERYGEPAAFDCPDGEALQVAYDSVNNRALVSYGETEYVLNRAISASGARYTNNDESIVFWEHQGSARLDIDEETVAADCTTGETTSAVDITPIEHATMLLEWDGIVVYTDPVGGAEAFAALPPPDFVLVTDIHGDHLSVETLVAVAGTSTPIVVPQAVYDELPTELQTEAMVLTNGETTEFFGIVIEAVPMYNLSDQGIEIRHEKGRGNGYVLERGSERVYIAGDTADIPEMRALQNIDVAFIPMNLPYTMDVERAADAVLDFAPARAIPYHYRTPDGFSDVERFKELVEASSTDITVELLQWYP